MHKYAFNIRVEKYNIIYLIISKILGITECICTFNKRKISTGYIR